eukprot:scaffold549_cov385-Prasinococcus_capsulatus_cf.AAC.8
MPCPVADPLLQSTLRLGAARLHGQGLLPPRWHRPPPPPPTAPTHAAGRRRGCGDDDVDVGSAGGGGGCGCCRVRGISRAPAPWRICKGRAGRSRPS